jgi:hypothetical protein
MGTKIGSIVVCACITYVSFHYDPNHLDEPADGPYSPPPHSLSISSNTGGTATYNPQIVDWHNLGD